MNIYTLAVNRHALLFLALFYIIVRYGCRNLLREFGPYSLDIFEALCVAAAVVIYGKKFLELLKPVKAAWPGTVAAAVAGFIVLTSAEYSGMYIPFNLTAPYMLFLILIFSPLAEEVIVRFIIWQPLQNIFKKPTVPYIVTTFLYSYSHLHSIWFTPNKMHGFIFFQTVYTLFLGLACGFYVYRYSSLGSAILLHFGFNLGFCIASFFYL